MTIGSWIVLLFILLLLAGAIAGAVRNRKKGCHGGDCGTCTQCKKES